MSEERQRAIDEEGEAMRLSEESSTLECAQQMYEQDPLPDLHNLTKRLTVRAHVVKPLMDAKRIG